MQSDEEYRRWLARFAVGLLLSASAGVLLFSLLFLRDRMPWPLLITCVASGAAIALLIAALPWYRFHQAWFLIPHCLTLGVAVALVHISGRLQSPFRLLLVAVLMFTIAYFEHAWLWISTGSLIAGFIAVHRDNNPASGWGHGVIEAACLVLIAFIGSRTIQALREQRRWISQLNVRIHEQRAQLVEATRTQTTMQLAGGVAHELNQPLTVLLAESDRLRRLPQLPADAKESLEHCFQAAQKAARIVQELQQLTTHTTTPYVGGVEITHVSTSP